MSDTPTPKKEEGEVKNKLALLDVNYFSYLKRKI